MNWCGVKRDSVTSVTPRICIFFIFCGCPSCRGDRCVFCGKSGGLRAKRCEKWVVFAWK